jgi:hypothetical protein
MSPRTAPEADLGNEPEDVEQNEAEDVERNEAVAFRRLKEASTDEQGL